MTRLEWSSPYRADSKQLSIARAMLEGSDHYTALTMRFCSPALRSSAQAVWGWYMGLPSLVAFSLTCHSPRGKGLRLHVFQPLPYRDGQWWSNFAPIPLWISISTFTCSSSLPNTYKVFFICKNSDLGLRSGWSKVGMESYTSNSARSPASQGWVQLHTEHS